MRVRVAVLDACWTALAGRNPHDLDDVGGFFREVKAKLPGSTTTIEIARALRGIRKEARRRKPRGLHRTDVQLRRVTP